MAGFSLGNIANKYPPPLLRKKIFQRQSVGGVLNLGDTIVLQISAIFKENNYYIIWTYYNLNSGFIWSKPCKAGREI